MIYALKRVLLGNPLTTAQARYERLAKIPALAIFASDNLSSVAYATEEILLVLVLAGTSALSYSPPIGMAIGLLTVIVASSYWQTIHAYPSGGGAYTVAKDNLGTYPGLVAGAALLVDYVLTVSVSVAAGVAAITSAFPVLYPHRVALCVGVVLLIMMANLRGIRETGRIFAAPTYWFILCLVILLGGGFYHLLTQGAPPLSTTVPEREPLNEFLVLRAFASGCAALTGIEAVANGVQAFKPPESRNAGITLAWMAFILGSSFLGVTFLAYFFHIVPVEGETVVSMLGRQIFGSSWVYYMIQAATAVILILAANTSFAGFPMLASMLGKDGFLPRQFANRGDRLVFSNGIIILASVSSLLLVIFGGSTHALIPLYAVGVFTAFTLSQAGMVRHWWKERGPRWRPHAAINGLGAVVTAAVVTVIGVSKFVHGAWMIIIIIPVLVVGFLAVRRHYSVLARGLSLEGFSPPKLGRHPVVVLVAGIHRGVVTALSYARAISPNVTAITVDLDPTATSRLQMQWREWAPDVPLVVLDSPYRSVLLPILNYIDQMEKQQDGAYMTIILPEFIPAKWWQHLLHNQTALLIKGALLFRRGKVAISIPYHLDQ
ncbi:MAG: APC family permease [candidate division NC10 bacterium]|nr:APC family permease [candidate division NC10 bacterium]MBI2457261.1 APC family permease [candidate division NC10 bacterium]MBI3086365.1 APC family permease [candidate division NC10 bacterium]